MNCGDWVESCTALVEHEDGRFEIITWTDPLRRARSCAFGGGARRGVMRILVATDAWHPQVNGVVRTLTMMAEAAQALGAEVTFLTPQSFRTFAMPSYPDLRLALPSAAKVARLIDDARPDSIHIATEGPIGLAGAALLPQAPIAVHHQLSYPLSRIYFRAAAGSRILDLGRAAPVPSGEPGGDGGDAGAGERIARPRLSQRGAVAARRRYRAVSSARRRSWACRVRSFCASAGSRWKRISRRFSISICRAPRWLSATGRRGRR